MILKKAFLFIVAAAAIAAAAMTLVVALAFALYALARDWVGPAGASAIVAAAAALVLLAIGLSCMVRLKPRKPEATLTERLTSFAKDKPLAAAAAAVVASVVAVRNPLVLAAIMKMVLEPKTRRRP